MKSIRKICSVLVLLPVMAWTQEQSVELFSIPLTNPGKPGKVTVEQISGSIRVEAYEGAEVIVKVSRGEGKSMFDNDKEPANAPQGMKRVNGTPINISAEERNNEVEIVNEQWNRVTNLEIKVPVNFSMKLSTINNGDITVEGVNGELEISNVNGGITLSDVSGSASTDTVNGTITVTFNRITDGAPMAFSSLNGDLDITFPASTKANLKLRTDMGDIFTDFEMDVNHTNPSVSTEQNGGTYKVKLEQWLYGKINGGGPEMLFKTFNGDIRIRSK